MSAANSNASPCLGFLSIVENAELGLLGGYLLLNAAGRPLEFHCTAPVKANRTQEILYGATLKPYLYGEQIGQTLLAKTKLKPIVVCTDSEAALAVREFTETPAVLVLDESGGRESVANYRPDLGLDTSATDSRPLSFALGLSQVVTTARYTGDEQLIRAAWPAQADHLDMLEPFTRIREALDEAQKAARQAA